MCATLAEGHLGTVDVAQRVDSDSMKPGDDDDVVDVGGGA